MCWIGVRGWWDIPMREFTVWCEDDVEFMIGDIKKSFAIGFMNFKIGVWEIIIHALVRG